MWGALLSLATTYGNSRIAEHRQSNLISQQGDEAIRIEAARALYAQNAAAATAAGQRQNLLIGGAIAVFGLAAVFILRK